MQTGDTASIQSRFDIEAFRARIFTGLNPDPRIRKGVESGIEKNRGQIIGRLLGSPDAHYDYLKPFKWNGEDILLFRMVSDEVGFLYLGLVLEPSGEKFVDIANFGTGELVSKSYRRTLLFLTNQNLSFLQRFAGVSPKTVEIASRIKTMGAQMTAGNYAEA
ncbi:MAG: hypothetical protein AAFU79_05515, partial [Myxococcota bacterium]